MIKAPDLSDTTPTTNMSRADINISSVRSAKRIKSFLKYPSKDSYSQALSLNLNKEHLRTEVSRENRKNINSYINDELQSQIDEIGSQFTSYVTTPKEPKQQVKKVNQGLLDSSDIASLRSQNEPEVIVIDKNITKAAKKQIKKQNTSQLQTQKIIDAKTPSMFDEVLEESSQSSHEFTSSSDEKSTATYKKSKVQFGKVIKKRISANNSSKRPAESSKAQNPLDLKRQQCYSKKQMLSRAKTFLITPDEEIAEEPVKPIMNKDLQDPNRDRFIFSASP